MDLKKATVSWSGGKDSALALHTVKLSGAYEIAHLHTVFDGETRRVGLHGVHESLVERQAASLGLPLRKLYLPASGNHAAYEQLAMAFYRRCAADGITHIVFGDIFLEDLRAFRESLLRASGLEPVFPLWRQPSPALLEEFLRLGFQTIVCAANASVFPRELLGKTIDGSFATSLPAGIDCCGENGEFHTFVYDGPGFRAPVRLKCGDVVERTYTYRRTTESGAIESAEATFGFQDLLGA